MAVEIQDVILLVSKQTQHCSNVHFARRRMCTSPWWQCGIDCKWMEYNRISLSEVVHFASSFYVFLHAGGFLYFRVWQGYRSTSRERSTLSLPDTGVICMKSKTSFDHSLLTLQHWPLQLQCIRTTSPTELPWAHRWKPSPCFDASSWSSVLSYFLSGIHLAITISSHCRWRYVVILSSRNSSGTKPRTCCGISASILS